MAVSLRATAVVLGLAVGGAWMGCDSGGDTDTSRPADFGFQTSVRASLIEEGRIAYERYCVGCHGPRGDGAGEAAVFLRPKPRNFRLANFKFSSTRSGQLPTDDDLKRTIRRGLRGSAMPAFDLLADRTISALVAYVKTFSGKWQERESGTPVPVAEDPYRGDADKSAAIRRGAAVYHGLASCWNCHPAYVAPAKLNEYLVAFGNEARSAFRDNLQRSVGKRNVEGEVIYPPDFLRDFVRAGVRVEDLYRSIAAGITGTAMPTWVDSIDIPGVEASEPPIAEPSDLWAMAYYVQDLIAQRPAKLAAGGFEVRARSQTIDLGGAAVPAAEEEAAPEDEEYEDEEYEEEEEFEEE